MLSVYAILMLTIAIFLALTSPSPSPSSASASVFVLRLLGSDENVPRELLLTIEVEFASAGTSSSPDLRFDLLGGILVPGHGVMQQVHRTDINRGLDSVGEVRRGPKRMWRLLCGSGKVQMRSRS
jgi:hypothetical protein